MVIAQTLRISGSLVLSPRETYCIENTQSYGMPIYIQSSVKRFSSATLVEHPTTASGDKTRPIQ